jgi:hypothetical protein
MQLSSPSHNFNPLRYKYRILSSLFSNTLSPCSFSNVKDQVHVRWLPCHRSMARLQVADGRSLQLYTLDNLPQTVDKGQCSSLGVEHGENNLTLKITLSRKFIMSLRQEFNNKINYCTINVCSRSASKTPHVLDCAANVVLWSLSPNLFVYPKEKVEMLYSTA